MHYHFVHTLRLDEYYSAAEFEKDVLVLLERVCGQHEHVILSGGSMMYIDAVTKGIDDIPTVDDDTREMLHQRFVTEGLDPLLAELKLLDPAYYELVDKKNHKRVVHALEICYMTGRPYSSFRTNSQKQRPFRIIKIGLNSDREELSQRIIPKNLLFQSDT